MARYQQSFPLYKNTHTSLLTAWQAFTNLGWTIAFAGDRALGAYPPAVFKKKDFMITCRVENDQLTVESQTLSDQSFDLLQKNKKNTNRFIEAFTSAQTLPEETLAALQQPLETLRLQTREQAEKDIQDAEAINQAFNFHNSNLYLTYSIIGVNTLLFILMVINGAGLFEPNALVHIRWGSNYTPLTLSGDWWRLLSNTFVHFGVIHLLMNMYCLYSISIYLEPLLGKLRFITAYCCTGVIGSLVSLWWHPGGINSAGASGAVFGMYGVFLALLTTKLVPEAVRKSLLQSIVIFIGYNLVYGMKSGVDNAAHAGGLVSGFIIGYAFVYMVKSEKSGKQLQWMPAAIAVLTVVASFFYLQQHQVPVKERNNALAILKDMGYADNEKFDKVLQQFDAYTEKEYKMLSDSTQTGERLSEKIDHEAMPAWEKLEQQLTATSTYDISPASHEKATNLLQYIAFRKKELQVIKRMTTEGQTTELVDQLNATRDSSHAVYQKVVDSN